VSAPSHQAPIAQILIGSWLAQAVSVVARLGIADRLVEAPKTADALAHETVTHPQALGRLLRGLAAVGLFAQDESGRWSLTEAAQCLRSDAPGSQHALAALMGEEHYQCMGRMLDSVRTGRPVFAQLYGVPMFDYLSARADLAKAYDAAMTGLHGSETDAVLDAVDFSGVQVLADVGGGNGSMLAGILRRHPAMRGILFDLPGVQERAAAQLGAAQVSDRCQVIPGNFFDSVPAGADAYLLRHIIHDWPDDRVRVILHNTFRVMKPGGRLLIVEHVVSPGGGPFGALLDLAILVMLGGLIRTPAQFRQLFADAGFRFARITQTAAEVSVIEAERP
jgi:ubiquinone/menaquinone biosynthesis C-methylase UbiE